MKGPKRQDILGEIGDAAQKNPLHRQLVIMHKPASKAKIYVGSFYEINHSELPPTSPARLHSVRIVMVTAKTELNVTIRYPSNQSLEAYFCSVESIGSRAKMYPEMDEKFVMGPIFAANALGRQIPSQEFVEFRHYKSLWLIDSFDTDQLPSPVSVCDAASEDFQAKNGSLFLNLQNSGFNTWGVKRVVRYLRDPSDHQEKTSEFHREGKWSVKEEESHEMKVNELSQHTRVEEDHEMKVTELIQYTRKRKRGRPAGSKVKKSKHSPKVKSNEQKPKIKEIKATKEGAYVERWPAKRYEAAAKDLAEVLKANGAVYGNPITRFELRVQARNRIGDTGLLDHLLKHLAGKVIPGGNERLRRRCDAEGKMEYWLESADLVNIRKEAGIQDPYWTPPPGWKPGDCLGTRDCRCGQEVRLLKDELSSMRRQIEVLKWKDEAEDAITLVLPDSAPLTGRPNRGELKTSKEMYEALLQKKSIMEDQLLHISKALLELEEDMNMLSNKEAAAATQELYNHGEFERERQAQRPRMIKLKPCKRQDHSSNLSSQAVADLMALTPASASPLSTTTS